MEVTAHTSALTQITVDGSTYDFCDGLLTTVVSNLVKDMSGSTIQEAINEAASGINDTIKALDFTGVTDGSVITQVKQENGLISASAASLSSTDETVTVNGLDLAVNIDGTTIVKGTGGKIGVASSAITVTGKDAIKVTTGATGNQVELVIAEANKVLTQTNGGLDTTLGLKFVKATDNTADGENKGKAVVQLTGVGNAVLGEFDATDLVMDGVLETVELEDGTLTFTWNAAAGSKTTEINLSDYIEPYEAGDGINIDGTEISVKVKTDDKYLTVDENGVASKGIDEAIAAAVDALDAEEESEGDFVSVKVTEVDGKITAVSVTESDIASETALNAEITARKAIDGQEGQTYAANTGATYISGATSLNDADVKLDAQIKTLAEALANINIEVTGTTLVITTKPSI